MFIISIVQRDIKYSLFLSYISKSQHKDLHVPKRMYNESSLHYMGNDPQHEIKSPNICRLDVLQF